MRTINYAVNDNITVKAYLQSLNYSRKSISAIKQNGALLVNGNHVTVRYVLHSGDTLTVQLPQETRSKSLISNDIPVKVLYNDDDVIVVSKPPFMNTIPSRLHPHNSLIEAVYGVLEKLGDNSVLHPVSRLDRDTSGLIVFSKHQLTHHLLTNKIEKHYALLAEGHVNDAGNYVCPINRADDSIITRIVHVYGQHARTEYKLMTYYASTNISYVRAKLHTGRTHQIRVHFSSAGHPLIGDTLYGGQQVIARQALHAISVMFKHPITGENITIEDDLPEDFKSIQNEEEDIWQNTIS